MFGGHAPLQGANVGISAEGRSQRVTKITKGVTKTGEQLQEESQRGDIFTREKASLTWALYIQVSHMTVYQLSHASRDLYRESEAESNTPT